jgi:hypothetical protein
MRVTDGVAHGDNVGLLDRCAALAEPVAVL